MTKPSHEQIHADVSRAITEDVGAGDLTAGLIDPQEDAEAQVICREPAILCGRDWFDAVFRQIDQDVQIQWLVEEAGSLAVDQEVCRLRGKAASILTAERSALNFLQLLSGVATKTARYVAAIQGTGAKILDTRKTIPGLRLAQKYAVACGGGQNHRMGLYDAILIKENHIRASGSIAAALSKAMAQQGESGEDIEIEVESLEELHQALSVGAKRVLLDNFSLDHLRKAVSLNAVGARLEASGGVDLDSVRGIAETGVDDISVGGLTKDVRAVDFSMLFVDA